MVLQTGHMSSEERDGRPPPLEEPGGRDIVMVVVGLGMGMVVVGWVRRQVR